MLGSSGSLLKTLVESSGPYQRQKLSSDFVFEPPLAFTYLFYLHPRGLPSLKHWFDHQVLVIACRRKKVKVFITPFHCLHCLVDPQEVGCQLPRCASFRGNYRLEALERAVSISQSTPETATPKESSSST